MPIRFTVRLRDPQVDMELPEGVFTPPAGEWELHPLSELKGLLTDMEGKEK
jgi:hypothetical protein